ncbi:LamG domain-containing protein [Nonomuraea sp. NPDC049637]|uniref:LamG domain-containing protein n=1 Tax=Nonomuraea sp. NPDC049637 TaxID=3154356 RepID=UPI00341F51BA
MSALLRSPRRRLKARAAAVALVMATVTSTAVGTVMVAGPAVARPPSQEPVCAASAAKAADALAMARACDDRVEVESERTPTTQVFANPDGTGTVEQYASPQRVRHADGSWTKPDTTLTRGADGTLAARATTADVRFSGGGPGPLVRAGRDGGELTLSWPEPLPAPEVDGARATYRDVRPGLDLVATALGTGFSFVLVVRTREAARDPALREVSLTTTLSGLTWDGPRAVDRSGRALFSADAPAMWDSSGRGSSAAAPAEDARTAAVGLSVRQGRLVLKPDPRLLADPAAAFPLYVDPTIGYTYWTMINEAAKGTSYWSYDRSNCSGGWETECAKVGYYPDGNDGAAYSRYRSMFQFSAAPFQGRQILDGARFTIDLLSSASCADSTTWLHTVPTTLSPGTTWDLDAWKWSGTEVVGVANNSCHYARTFTEFALPSWAVSDRQHAGWLTFGLRAADEGTSAGWKKFDATTARLIVSTNIVPAAPADLTVDGKACATGASRPYVSTLTPTWRARVSDGDGEGLKTSFYWQLIHDDGTPAEWSPRQGPLDQHGVPSGATAVVTPSSGIAENATYSFWATASDAHATGAESVRCEFVTDTVRPDAARVTGDVYQEGDTVSGGVGQTGTFTFASSPDVAMFKWGLSDPPAESATPARPGAPVTVSWTPAEGGGHTLSVIAVDRAGNQSPRRTYQFIVGSPAPALARWKLDEPEGTATASDDTGNGRDLTLGGGASFGEPGRLLPGPDGRSRGALRLDSADDRAARPDFMDTGTSFAVSAWVKLARKGADGDVVAQPGGANRAFSLSYDAGADRWAMTVTSRDAAGAAAATARSATVPRAGVWTHLTGVHDAATKKVHLYVNGALEGSATASGSWDASGDFQVGGGSFDGAVAEVQAWNRVVADTEAAALADPKINAKVAEWHFDEVGPGPAYDSSGMYRDLTFYGGAQIPESGAGYAGTGLRLDGVDDYVAPADAVVGIDQSFTVSAWVRHADLGRAQTFVAGGFHLYYDPINGGKWVFALPASATDWSGGTFAITSVVTPGEYHNLVGVFDAQQRHLRLYVDGTLKVTTPMSAAWQPWRSRAPLRIGRNYAAAFVKGDIDEVQLFQGVVSNPGASVPGVAGRVDFNGDGRADHCRRAGDGRLACTLSTGTGFGITVTSGPLDWGQDTGRAWVDADGDGKSDFCRVRGTRNHTDAYLSCTLSNGTDFGPEVNSGNTDWGYAADRAWVDANGDGKVDYCRRVGGADAQRVACTPFSRSGFGTLFLSRPLDWGQETGRAWADVNGDGKADYCRVVGTQNHTDAHVSCTPSTGTAFGPDIVSANLDWGYTGNRAWTDVNGDGRADYCRGVGAPTSQAMACTPSTGDRFGTSFLSQPLDWGQETGRAWADVNGDGKADYCRVLGTQNHTDARVGCMPSTGTGFGPDIVSANLDWGYAASRSWADVNGDGRADYCRRTGSLTAQGMGCTPSAGAGFGTSFYSAGIDWGQEN